MSKKDEVVKVEVASSKYYLNKIKQTVPPKLLDKLKRRVNKEIKDLDSHMEEHGWDLDFEYIKNDILNDIISHYFEWYLMARVMNRGHHLQFKKNKLGSDKLMITKGNKDV